MASSSARIRSMAMLSAHRTCSRCPICRANKSSSVYARSSVVENRFSTTAAPFHPATHHGHDLGSGPTVDPSSSR